MTADNPAPPGGRDASRTRFCVSATCWVQATNMAPFGATATAGPEVPIR